MKTTIAIVLTSFAVLFAAGCAELDESGGIGVHPPDWSKEGSSNNHAAALTEAGLPNSAQDCSGCHGADFGTPDDDCFECHHRGGDQGHPESGFIPPSGDEFHGQKVIDAGGTDKCGECHSWEDSGELDFDLGGWSQQPCNTCHAGGRSGHPSSPNPWFNSASPDFHGEAVKGPMTPNCSECHGADYLGGWTDVSCLTCHDRVPSAHPPEADWTNPSSPDFHGLAASGAGIAGCSGCHGADYLGAWTSVSCATCHTTTDIHPVGWVALNETEGSHGNLILANNGLSKNHCRGCHGTGLEGGWSGVDCRPCHNNYYGPPPRH